MSTAGFIEGYPTLLKFRNTLTDASETIMFTGDGPLTGPGGVEWTIERGQSGTTPLDFDPLTTEIVAVLNVDTHDMVFAQKLDSGYRQQRPMEGRLFLVEDPGFMVNIWTRTFTVWDQWAPIFHMKPPLNTGFSWVNQGSATIDFTNGAGVLSSAGSVGDDVHMRVKSTSADTPIIPPYFYQFMFHAGLSPVDQTSAGVVFRESSTGKFIFFRLMYDTTSSIAKNDLIISVDKYTNPTTFSANYNKVSANIFRSSVLTFRIDDDGTDLLWYVSGDTKNFSLIHQASRTDFLATGPNQFGFAVNSNTTSGNAVMTLYSLLKLDPEP